VGLTGGEGAGGRLVRVIGRRREGGNGAGGKGVSFIFFVREFYRSEGILIVGIFFVSRGFRGKARGAASQSARDIGVFVRASLVFVRHAPIALQGGMGSQRPVWGVQEAGCALLARVRVQG